MIYPDSLPWFGFLYISSCLRIKYIYCASDCEEGVFGVFMYLTFYICMLYAIMFLGFSVPFL